MQAEKVRDMRGPRFLVMKARRSETASPNEIERDTVSPAEVVRDVGLARETIPVRLKIYRFTSAVRVVFGVIWLVDAYYKWQPSFLAHYNDLIAASAKGQPALAMPWFNFWHKLFSFQPAFFGYATAAGETFIALALILGFARKFTYAFGAAWTLMIWTTAEGFGQSDVPVVTDIGTAIIYTVVFLALLALDSYRGARAFSLDALIERRFPAWKRIAEVGK
jgi:uncharacterized membrane protein YphA (DoxX/SURF4 family)